MSKESKTSRHLIKKPVLANKGRKRIGVENRKILHPRPYCLNDGCRCLPGFRPVKCGCKQCNSGSAAADEVTQMKTLFDNMMDPFMPIYKCVNFVCRGRNCNYSYAEKCRCRNQKCQVELGVSGTGETTIRRVGNCGKNCDNDNAQNFFDRQNNDFDNQFNFNNNSLDRPNCPGAAIQPLPFVGEPNCGRRCVAGNNNNAVNEFDREADRFDNRFLLGDYQFQEA